MPSKQRAKTPQPNTQRRRNPTKRSASPPKRRTRKASKAASKAASPSKAASKAASNAASNAGPSKAASNAASKAASNAASKAASNAAVGRPGKVATQKKMPLDQTHKDLLIEKLGSYDLRAMFDTTDRYTKGMKGHEFTDLNAVDVEKMKSYVRDDEALNNNQFWQDYDQTTLKLKIPPKRKKQLKVSDLKNPNTREKKNIYSYVLGSIQEKMAEGYFDKIQTPKDDPGQGGV